MTYSNTGIRVLHVITGLGTGGAEAMLFKLLQATMGSITSRVVVLTADGSNHSGLTSLGIPVVSLGMDRGRLPGISEVCRLRRVVREFKPELIQGWMYHGNLAAWLAMRMAKGWPRLFWNVRQTLYDLNREPPLTRLVILIGARLSTEADAILYNSRVSARQHEAHGYSLRGRQIIPNGFDVQQWLPDPVGRRAVRAELGVADDVILIGQVARYHRMKGHHRLLQATMILKRRQLRLRLLLVGPQVSPDQPDLAEAVRSSGLEGEVILAGERDDIPRIMAALDILVSASEWGEGFPNVVGEAMASGLSCVVTDVGDSAELIGDCGRVVPAGEEIALANALEETLMLGDKQRHELGLRARARIQKMYSIELVADRYVNLYKKVGA